jgi:D-alanine-D-alanine ligase-like ATP-grasp enzyme
MITLKLKKAVLEKKLKGSFRPMIRSRHPSHSQLRYQLAKLPFRSVIRLGSLTELTDPATLKGTRIELNSREAIRNSSNKFQMKECFSQEGVQTAVWYCFDGEHFQDRSNTTESEDFDIKPSDMEYPLVAKHIYGSRGTGNTLIKSQIELQSWLINKKLTNYIFEKYYNYNKEYRLHITENGCFYSCRKMLKQEFKDHPNSWQRHDDNCIWILEENELFDKPNNWQTIVDNCVRALKSCKLDFGACDLRVQNNTDKDGEFRNDPNFIVVEINSAPSFGEMTLEKYKIELPKLLTKKYNEKTK